MNIFTVADFLTNALLVRLLMFLFILNLKNNSYRVQPCIYLHSSVVKSDRVLAGITVSMQQAVLLIAIPCQKESVLISLMYTSQNSPAHCAEQTDKDRGLIHFLL